MEIKLKPKTFGPVFIHTDQQRTIRYGRSDDSVDQVAPPTDSPADTLLFSLGACIAISLQMQAEKNEITLDAFQVQVTSKKAEDLPNRFDCFEVLIPRSIFEDPEFAESLLSSAKSICTVSNTLNAEVTLTLI